ncbi:MliC family protein [Paracoccus homiensis]|uniref:MliC family protein n=1 Tax=Paracoccus homiensis TaxID=364199 RepID=UPI00398CEBB8
MRLNRKPFPMLRIALSLCISAMPVHAGIGLSIPLDPTAQVTSATYGCDGGDPFTVQFINDQDNNLALLPVDGSSRIFVNVIAASGARYVSGAYEWRIKGDQATLTPLTSGNQRHCSRLPTTE